jgi:hypothetical protein
MCISSTPLRMACAQWKSLNPSHRPSNEFDGHMALLNHIVEVLHLTDLDGRKHVITLMRKMAIDALVFTLPWNERSLCVEYAVRGSKIENTLERCRAQRDRGDSAGWMRRHGAHLSGHTPIRRQLGVPRLRVAAEAVGRRHIIGAGLYDGSRPKPIRRQHRAGGHI